MPVSLEILNLSGGITEVGEIRNPGWGGTPNKFTGGIPAEWSSMTNLRELKMPYCGLDGECLVYVPGIQKKSIEKPIVRRTAAPRDLAAAHAARVEPRDP